LTTLSRGLLRKIWKNRVAYVFLAPFYIAFAVFGLFPIVAGFLTSFFNWNGLDPMRFVGLRNYLRVLTDDLFWKSLGNTAVIGLIAHVFILGGGLVVAYLLNMRVVRLRGAFKAIYFLPMVTSAVAAAIVFKALFGYRAGLINFVLHAFGVENVDWFGGSGAFVKVAVIIMFSWQWIGWNMVIYLAGMQAVNPDLYEAAAIDGASRSRIFFSITLPILKPVIAFTVVQSVIGTMGLFTEPFVLTGSLDGGTNSEGMTAMMYLLNKAPQGNNLYGTASAVAYVLTVVIVLVSMLTLRLLRDRNEPQAGAA
jgi:ABC-type sugar transport system permease subunit